MVFLVPLLSLGRYDSLRLVESLRIFLGFLGLCSEHFDEILVQVFGILLFLKVFLGRRFSLDVDSPRRRAWVLRVEKTVVESKLLRLLEALRDVIGLVEQ